MDLAKMQDFRKRDPLVLLRERVLAKGYATAEHLDRIDAEVVDETNRAVERALADPLPEPEVATQGVFA
jgi:TPP-dependent pyruvate/acetoin dehydrogenase alpha subunit